MVLTNTDSAGAGPYKPVTGSKLQQVTNDLAVYEILFADPFSLEQADVPVVVAYDGTHSSNKKERTVKVSGGFAPFYHAFGRQPSVFGSAPDVPRFVRAATECIALGTPSVTCSATTVPSPLFSISKK